MANTYLAIGVGRGLEEARRRMRAERQEDEDRSERKSELEYARGRRGIVDAREDEQYKYEIEQRPLEERMRNARVRGAELGTEAAETELNYAREDRPSQVRMRDAGVRSAELGVKRDEFELDDAKTSAGRESELHRVKMQQIGQQMEDEGMRRMLDALDGGADPEYAVKLFNAQGKNGIKPGSMRFDKASGAISFAGTGGKEFNGNIRQLRALLPQAAEPKPLVVGAGGSVYDPASKTFKQPPGAGTGRAGVMRNGQKLSPFNPQTHGKQTRDLVIQSLGGEWDNNLQKFKIPAGQGEKIAYATSLADQIVRLTSEEGMQLGPGEVNDIVVNVMREVRTAGEAEKMARSELGENAGADSVKLRAQELVEDSKIRAAQNLGQELEMMRARAQQQQNSQSWPEPPETSEDMEGGEGMDTPPVEMLREGYVQQFQDGSKWTLENGRPVRVE